MAVLAKIAEAFCGIYLYQYSKGCHILYAIIINACTGDKYVNKIHHESTLV